MDIKTFAETVEIMRNYQKNYFKERKPSDLQNSKLTEKCVDEMLTEILHPENLNQTKLEL